MSLILEPEIERLQKDLTDLKKSIDDKLNLLKEGKSVLPEEIYVWSGDNHGLKTDDFSDFLSEVRQAFKDSKYNSVKFTVTEISPDCPPDTLKVLMDEKHMQSLTPSINIFAREYSESDLSQINRPEEMKVIKI